MTQHGMYLVYLPVNNRYVVTMGDSIVSVDICGELMRSWSTRHDAKSDLSTIGIRVLGSGRLVCHRENREL